MTTETKPTLSLHRKLAQVMHEVGRVPKNGTAPREMGGYAFVQVGDAADAIRAALAEKLITMMPVGVQVVGQADRPTKSGGTMTTVDLIQTWRLTDAESGEFIEIQSFGAGADGGDKYSGKASTSAMKYALLTGFLLSTGEDSELGSPEAGRPAPRPHEDADSSPNDVPANKADDIEEMMGRVRRRGIIRKGTADNYKLVAKQGPDGHVFGFRLEIDGDKNIPQCLVAGLLGEALFLASGAKPETLIGKAATVAGLLYNVKRKDKPGSWYRLHVDRIETDEFILPSELPAPEDVGPEPPDTVELVGEADTKPLGLVV
jgi:hypothetical protein